MKERPILFSGPMVRAILEGRKTQTRRVVKPQPTDDGHGPKWYSGFDNVPGTIETNFPMPIHCPYGQPGDRLWVRETWAQHPEFTHRSSGGCLYRADRGGDYQGAAQGDFCWRPSIHMPRWASRITLEITGARVERLQDISEEDAKAEGIQWGMPCGYLDTGTSDCSSKCKFKSLWESINGPGSWDANPWVWVIEFKKL